MCISLACIFFQGEGQSVIDRGYAGAIGRKTQASVVIDTEKFLQMTLGEAPANIDKLPLVPAGLLWILGISHAGYLGSKGVDHTPKEAESKGSSP